MAFELRRLAIAALCVSGASCSLALDLDGYEVEVTDAGGEPQGPDASPPVTAGEAQFRSYRFERGAGSFRVGAEEGLLSGAAEGEGALAAGSLPTLAGGGVELSEDGAFEYTPPGAAGSFWGDDYFEFALLGSPAVPARVRLTVPPGVLDVSELAGHPRGGFGVAGAAAQDNVGGSQLGPAGDVNGDGLEDFVIGAMGPYDPNSYELPVGVGHSVHVLFGKRDTSAVDLADVSGGAGGFVVLTDDLNTTFDSFGLVVAAAGDVNGDGLDDIIIGSHSYESAFDDPAFRVGPEGLNVFGAAYVVFGKRDTAPVQIADIRAGRGGGFAILGPGEPFHWVGVSVDGAGDVNGDGLDDVIVGVPVAGEDEHGVAFVVFGKLGLEPVLLQDLAPGAAGGFPIVGTAEDIALGDRVAGIGDVNGDGLDDVAAGTPVYPDYDSWDGRVVVAFGRRDTTPIRVEDVEQDSSLGFLIFSADFEDNFEKVVGRGDVNGDGLDDVLAGANLASFGAPVPDFVADAGTPDAGADEVIFPNMGVVYAVFGSRSAAEVRLREVEDGSAEGFAIGGAEFGQQLGWNVVGADVTADGLADIIVTSPPGLGTRHAHVIFGSRSPSVLSLGRGVPSSDSMLTIRAPSFVASAVVSGADFNGDGLDDFLMDAQGYADAPQAAGGAYVVLGWDITGALRERDRALIGTSADDTFDLPLTAIVIARGGNGTDTLRAGNGAARIDLTLPGRFESIEIVDLRGGGPQELVLDDTALRRIPQNHSGYAFNLARRLTVLGDAEDTLLFDMTGYEQRGGNQGRIVYGRSGLHYGIELSSELALRAP